MATAKKLITAQIHLSAVKEFKGDLTESLSQTASVDEVIQLLSRRYGNGSVGELAVNLDGDLAKFRWILPKVVAEAEKLHKNALQKARSQQYSEAINNWIKAIALNPQDPDYYFNTGIAYFEEKNYQESIENLEYTIKLCPIYYKASLILGTVYLKVRKFEKAEYYLKESIYFNPTNPLAILNLGAVYSILKRYSEGIKAFEKVLQLVPDEPRAYFGLGKIYSILGEISEANECFHKTIELDTKGVLTQYAKRAIILEESSSSMALNLPSSYTERDTGPVDEKMLESAYAEGYKAFLYGDYPRAVKFYQKYVEHKSKDDYVWFSLGEAYLRDGKAKEATAAYKNAIRLAPNKALYYKQVAIAYDFLNAPDKAIEASEQATRFGKKDSIVYTIWGKNLLKRNLILDAIEKLENALKFNKGNINAEYHLALAYLKNNDPEAAVDHLHWIMNSKLKSPVKTKAGELLEKISIKRR